MARYTGAKLRVTRRLGDLPAFTSKKAINVAEMLDIATLCCSSTVEANQRLQTQMHRC